MFVATFFGFLIGFMVAATGIGGGVLLMPVLIVIFHVSPMAAVGTALLFMSVTKVWAVFLHWKQETVDFRLAGNVLIGSIPGAFVGSIAMAVLHHRMGDGINAVLQKAIGISLIVIALFALGLEWLKSHRRIIPKSLPANKNSELRNAIFIGFLGGFLVSATSLGSGSVILLLLLLFCPRTPMVLVGTDIFHAAILTTVAALIHLRFNPFELRLPGLLLAGSLPGVFLGVSMASRIAHVWLKGLVDSRSG
jgi:uncharacterized membrane protein YfcA